MITKKLVLGVIGLLLAGTLFVGAVAAAGENNISINVDDLKVNGTGLYYDNKTSTFFAYNNSAISIPLNLSGNASHVQLGGYNVIISVNGPNASTPVLLNTSNVTNMLNNWQGAKNQSGTNNVSVAYSVANKTSAVNLTTHANTTILRVNLSKVYSDGTNKTYDIYVLNTTGHGLTSMFSGLKGNYSQMEIADFDSLSFDAKNKGKIATITIKDLLKFVEFIVGNYSTVSNETAPQTINLFWERENATDSGIIANFSSNIPKVTSWTFAGNVSKYLSMNANSTSGTKATSSFKTNASQKLGEKEVITGNMTIAVQDEVGGSVAAVNNITIRHWLQNETWGNFSSVGDPLAWNLTVNAGKVNTSENATYGWNTYAKFPVVDESYRGIEIPNIKVVYSNATKTFDNKTYGVLNANKNESIMLGSDIYIKNNTINNASETVIISFQSYKLGDATMNTYINIADSSAMGVDILRKGALLNNTVNKFFADIDHKGTVDASDVQNVNKYLVGSK